MSTPVARRLAQVALIAAVTVAPLTACSDDDSDAADAETTTTAAETTTTAASTPASEDLDAFCAVATELAGITPTSEQLAEYAELAPEEIAEPVATFVAAFDAADGDLEAVFSDPEAIAASDEITAFEAEQCGLTPPGPPPGAPTPDTAG